MNEFKNGAWNREINVRDFIQRNYTPYDGDDSFLVDPSASTTALWNKLCDQMKIERQRNGVYDIDEKTRLIFSDFINAASGKDYEK